MNIKLELRKNHDIRGNLDLVDSPPRQKRNTIERFDISCIFPENFPTNRVDGRKTCGPIARREGSFFVSQVGRGLSFLSRSRLTCVHIPRRLFTTSRSGAHASFSTVFTSSSAIIFTPPFHLLQRAARTCSHPGRDRVVALLRDKYLYRERPLRHCEIPAATLASS